MTDLIDFDVRNRWTGAAHTRAATPRAKATVKARVQHGDGLKRKLNVFITEPVLDRLGWKIGGHVEVAFQPGVHGQVVRIRPAHSGLMLSKCSGKTSTVRVTVCGAPLVKAMCAKVREVPFQAQGGELFAILPADWFVTAALTEAA